MFGKKGGTLVQIVKNLHCVDNIFLYILNDGEYCNAPV